jgi:site-specific DNA recombinase
VERPQGEWQTRQAPELRIVSDALWQRVRGRYVPHLGRRGKGASPRTLFGGGMLSCHACGAAVVAINAARYGCSARKDRGPAVCPSGATVLRQVLDTRLLGELRRELLAPAALAELQREVQRLVAQMQRDAGGGLQAAQTRLQALQGEIGRLVDAVATVGLSAALQGRLLAAETERDSLQQQLDQARTAAQTPALQVDDVLARYRRQVLDIQRVLEQPDDHADLARTRAILAELLGRVTVGRDQASGEDFAELEEPAERLMLSAVGESLGMVAGACNPTRRRIALR